MNNSQLLFQIVRRFGFENVQNDLNWLKELETIKN